MTRKTRSWLAAGVMLAIAALGSGPAAKAQITMSEFQEYLAEIYPDATFEMFMVVGRDAEGRLIDEILLKDAEGKWVTLPLDVLAPAGTGFNQQYGRCARTKPGLIKRTKFPNRDEYFCKVSMRRFDVRWERVHNPGTQDEWWESQLLDCRDLADWIAMNNGWPDVHDYCRNERMQTPFD